MKSLKQFYEQMRDYFLSQLPDIYLNFNIGSRIRSLFESIASVLEELSFEADTEYQNLYIHSAFGSRLTMRARELGIERKPAQKATGWFRFFGPAQTQIPSGTRIANADPDITDNPIIFQTTQTGEIPDTGQIDIPIEAIEPGALYNLPTGALSYIIDEIPDVTGSNPSPTAGGADEETDEDLRHRCFLAPYRLARSIERCWESLACDITGVARAKCLSCSPSPGKFRIYIWSRDAAGRLVSPSPQLITTVQEYLNQFVPVCITLTVTQPTGPYQDIIAYLKISETAQFNEIMPLVKTALESVFSALLPGETLTRARLIAAAMSIPGVINFRLALPLDDVTPQETETIYPGTITIHPWEWDSQFEL
ncbi:MAG: baseplate J/gp47 family protein [candidate division WOR-3 bacterium]|nr:baseplate J/gp47 family protein [candidate division WOR-3 bacterium]